jgi:hypothetical protein
MSIYSRIFAATSKRLTSAGASGQRIPAVAFWAAPGLLGASWFIWGALNDDIKQSVGLYYDPDIVMKRVEAEREARMEAKEQLKAASKPKKDEEEDEEEEEEADEEEEEEVTAEDIEEAVSKAVEAAAGADDDEDGAGDDDDDDDDDDEEEEEEEKPKKPKVNFNKLSREEKWEYFAERAVIPGEDDDDVSNC